MDLTTISVVGALLISALTIISNICIAKINKKSELRQTLIKLIYQEWEYRTELIKEFAPKYGKQADLIPFNESLLFYKNFLELIDKRNITEEDIKKFFQEQKRLDDIYDKYQDEYQGDSNRL